MDDVVVVNRIVWDQLIEQVPWDAGEARQAFPPMNDKIVVDRARFERLLELARSAYADKYEAIVAKSRLLQDGDLDPIP